MVKDEEEMLPSCLESIKDVADEIIVVDTGSTDRTVEIAESYGAKVYHHPWENNFSKHRNQSISYATGDWFFTIDADERLESERISKTKLKQTLRELPDNVNAVLVTMKDYRRTDEKLKLVWKVTKLFRNNAGVYFEGEVHNQPVVPGEAIDSDLVIKHYGYDLSKAKMKKKFERTNTLLQERIKGNPADWEAYFYLANLYGSFNKYDEGIEYGKKMLEIIPEESKNELYLKVYFNIGAGYLRLEQYEQAKEWFLKGLEVLPDDLDIHFGLAIVGIHLKDLALVETHSRAFLARYDNWMSNEIKAGLRFIYHMDQQYRSDILSGYLTALIGKRDISKLEEAWEEYETEIYSDTRVGLNLLHNLFSMDLMERFLEYATKLIRALPHESEFLYPLIDQYRANNLSKEWFFHFVETVILKEGNYYLFSEIINILLHQDLLETASEMIAAFSGNGLPEGFDVAKQAMLLIRQGRTGEALRLVKQGIALQVDDQEFYINAIPFLYRQAQNQLLVAAIENAMRYYESFEEIPEIILLPLSINMVKQNKLTHLLNIAETLCKRHDISSDRVLHSWEDFAEIYQSLAEYFVSEGRDLPAQMAWEVCFTMTGNGEFLECIGDLFFRNERYDEALQNYAIALDNEYQSKSMIRHMKQIFQNLDDTAGLAQCEELMAVYDTA